MSFFASRSASLRRLLLGVGVAGLAVAVAAPTVSAANAKTKRVSVRSGGGQANASSFDASVSADGRFVAFHSTSTDLVPGDGNGSDDIFVHDRTKKRTRRVSVKTGGAAGDDDSFEPTISANGRFVAFSSRATNLVKNDDNDKRDVFVHDRKTKKTKRVSVRSNGAEGNGDSRSAFISGNGRYIVFLSGSTNLVKNDDNDELDIFVHDRKTKKTKRVSVRSNGAEADGPSRQPTITSDGRLVAFSSEATNLVKNDDNGVADVFVHDRKMKKTKRVSVKSGGGEASDSSFESSMSANGRFVAFGSNAPNLVGNDNNDAGDIFVHDRRKKRTRRMSIGTDGGEGSKSSFEPVITANGRYVYFATDTDDLVDSDTNGETDILRRDRLKKRTKVISKKNGGGEAQELSEDPWVTPDGRWVVFESDAKLHGSDTNIHMDIYIRGPLR